jgi:hypothetical protein
MFVLGRVADTFARIFRCKTGPIDYEWGISSASTDFVRFLLRIIDSQLSPLIPGKYNIWYNPLQSCALILLNLSQRCHLSIPDSVSLPSLQRDLTNIT